MATPDIRRTIGQREAGKQSEIKPLDRNIRLQKLTEMLRGKGVDAMLLSQPANIDYFTGFTGVEPQEREAYALIGANGERDFISRELYFGQAPKGFEKVDIFDFPAHLQNLKQSGVQTIGIEKENLTVAEYEMLQKSGLEIKGLEPKELREKKTEEEIDRIREACRLGDTTFSYVLTQIKEGQTEQQLRDILENHMRSLGVEKPSFPTIVAYGANAANPHHMPDGTPLTPGNFITFDFGFVGKDGYQSDMTRTAFFGQPTADQIKMYAITLKAQEAVIDYLQQTFTENPKAQPLGKEIDSVARQIILAAGYAPEHFPHGLGHSIGIETHETPFLNKKSEQTIEAGMVFSDEPGIYIPGFQGVRIEDLIAIHEDGNVEVLTHSPKDLICVDPVTGKQTVISAQKLLSEDLLQTT